MGGNVFKHVQRHHGIEAAVRKWQCRGVSDHKVLFVSFGMQISIKKRSVRQKLTQQTLTISSDFQHT
ncbi:hypothetical protein LN457_01360 [Xanthomonas phaseoli]|nr:hypothetical protein [Xanthomonas phaseoli]MCC8531476.1 hypothetical protein [Xanthomonas phaseoli]UEQ14511.1 hypothetical protein K9838_17960 [Xanthomonas phaseoli pv. manihotis]